MRTQEHLLKTLLWIWEILPPRQHFPAKLIVRPLFSASQTVGGDQDGSNVQYVQAWPWVSHAWSLSSTPWHETYQQSVLESQELKMAIKHKIEGARIPSSWLEKDPPINHKYQVWISWNRKRNFILYEAPKMWGLFILPVRITFTST